MGADDNRSAPWALLSLSELGVQAYIFSRLGFLLARADQIAGALFAAEDGPDGPTLLQHQLLTAIDGLPSPAQTALARAIGLDTSTVALMVGNLLTAGAVKRETSAEDRRRK